MENGEWRIVAGMAAKAASMLNYWGFEPAQPPYRERKHPDFLVHLRQPRRGEISITEGAIIDAGKAPKGRDRWSSAGGELGLRIMVYGLRIDGRGRFEDGKCDFDLCPLGDIAVERNYGLASECPVTILILFHNLHSVEVITYVRSLKPRFIETIWA